MQNNFTISGNIVDVVFGEIFAGTIEVAGNRISKVTPCAVAETQYILPGLIDSHVHIESSMLVPAEFARLAVPHGTVATVSDPHEIANVLGVPGIDFMIENGRLSPFKFFFGAPSCVPATGFESSGASIDSVQTGKLLEREDIFYLSEMMNFPGVLFGDEEVRRKLDHAKRCQKPIDGHAPSLDAENISKYAASGISTDHESTNIHEALLKIGVGMHILIREGSAARNFDVLIPLLAAHPEKIMFCSDDKHPDDLVSGHINLLAKRAIKLGYNPLDVVKACTLNPVRHYKLPCGLLQPGDAADICVIDNLHDFNVLNVFIDGNQVAANGKSLLKSNKYESPNCFVAEKIVPRQLEVPAGIGMMKVIEAFDGNLFTGKQLSKPLIVDNKVVSDTERDILKITVINRYQPSEPAVAFITGFGFKKGALASTVAHDSHNIIGIGTNDADLVAAINSLIGCQGGIAIAENGVVDVLPLPVAGLMSAEDGYEVATRYELINKKARQLGGSLKAPFMTLSFMALLVLPELKLSDKGLFDGSKFAFTELFMGNENQNV